MFMQLFEKNFNEKVLNCQLTDLGITNNVFLVETNNAKYLVRKPKKENFNNYKLETEIEKLIEHLDISIHPVYIDDSGIKVTIYNPYLKTFNDFTPIERAEVPVKLLKKLHNSKIKCSVDFDHANKLLDYKNGADNQLFNVENYLYILDEIKHLKYDPILCHNDLVEGNICLDNEQSFLIDYEYASNNDPYFDVMSFLTENTLTTFEVQEFLTNYFDTLNNDIIEHLKIWETYHNLLWYYWANMMYYNTDEDIFLNIATDKHNALQTSILKGVQ